MCNGISIATDFSDYITDYVLERSELLFLAFDGRGRVICANRSAEELLPAPISEQTIDQLFIDFNGELHPETLGDSNKQRMFSLNTKSGRPVSYMFSFLRRPGNIVLAFGGLDYAQIHSANEKLFDSVNEISNLTRELHKKNVELERLNELKNRFLGIAAHDLRNPAGAIMGFSDILKSELSETLGADNLEILEMIHSQSQYMLEIINNFLDFAAIESGRMNVHLEPADLCVILKECVALYESLAAKKKIQMDYMCDLRTAEVPVDAQKIKQVVNNLLSNALKFSHPSSVVTLRLEDRGQELAISVSDQGQGIPQEEQEKLFKPFTQTSVRSTEGEKSTGLGLSIVKKIVEAHKGRIEVESQVGTGTTFLIVLPKS